MKRSKFTEEQIAFVLKQAESGVTVAEVCRKMGVSENTTTGRKSSLGWVYPNCVGSGSWRKRTASSSSW